MNPNNGKTESSQRWPDALEPADPARVEELLSSFWLELRKFPSLLAREENLLAQECTARLRSYVLEMMLALNGIRRPETTQHLDGYLGISQREAIQKTLLVPAVAPQSWIGQAVGLIVIYRWYAPQLAEKFDLTHPQQLEDEITALLQAQIPDWPTAITTDPPTAAPPTITLPTVDL